MKKILLLWFFGVMGLGLWAQTPYDTVTVVDPQNFTLATTIDTALVQVISRKANANRRINFQTIKNYSTPDITLSWLGIDIEDTTGISATYRDFFVTDNEGEVWFVDNAGSARKLYDPAQFQAVTISNDTLYISDNNFAIIPGIAASVIDSVSYYGDTLRIYEGGDTIPFKAEILAGLPDGDYGDITVSGYGTVMNIDTAVVGPIELASTAVTPGSYTNAGITVDADGRITAASSGAVQNIYTANDSIEAESRYVKMNWASQELMIGEFPGVDLSAPTFSDADFAYAHNNRGLTIGSSAGGGTTMWDINAFLGLADNGISSETYSVIDTNTVIHFATDGVQNFAWLGIHHNDSIAARSWTTLGSTYTGNEYEVDSAIFTGNWIQDYRLPGGHIYQGYFAGLGVTGTASNGPLSTVAADAFAQKYVIQTRLNNTPGNSFDWFKVYMDYSDTTSNAITLYNNKYNLVNDNPSASAGDTSIMVWVGADEVFFLDKSEFGGGGTDTDNQTLDTFTIVSNILRASLEDDGEPFQSVDLSPYLDNTDAQTIDTFSRSGSTISLSLEGDNEPAVQLNLSIFAQTIDTDRDTIWISGTGNTTRTPGPAFLRDSITGAALTIDLKQYNQAVVEIRMETCTSTTLTINNPWSATDIDATYPTFEGETGVYSFHFLGISGTDNVTWPADFLDMNGTALGTDALITGTMYTCYRNPVSAKYYCK